MSRIIRLPNETECDLEVLQFLITGSNNSLTELENALNQLNSDSNLPSESFFNIFWQENLDGKGWMAEPVNIPMLRILLEYASIKSVEYNLSEQTVFDNYLSPLNQCLMNLLKRLELEKTPRRSYLSIFNSSSDRDKSICPFLTEKYVSTNNQGHKEKISALMYLSGLSENFREQGSYHFSSMLLNITEMIIHNETMNFNEYEQLYQGLQNEQKSLSLERDPAFNFFIEQIAEQQVRKKPGIETTRGSLSLVQEEEKSLFNSSLKKVKKMYFSSYFPTEGGLIASVSHSTDTVDEPTLVEMKKFGFSG